MSAMTPCSLQRPFVNELNRTLEWYWLQKPQDPYNHWARNAFGSFEMRMKAAAIWQLVFMSRRQVWPRAQDRDHGDEDEATPLLACAMEFPCSRKKIIFPLSDPHFVEVLLRSPARRSNRGANHVYSDLVARTRCCASCGKRIAGGFIRPYDTDPEGTMRWTRIRIGRRIWGSHVSLFRLTHVVECLAALEPRPQQLVFNGQETADIMTSSVGVIERSEAGPPQATPSRAAGGISRVPGVLVASGGAAAGWSRKLEVSWRRHSSDTKHYTNW
ncbi:hypothetical protein AAL_03292 [Moelleriella libera RCEF 2490]|uniref:Uncharacterized protein n=1 Tax=Moelleriella libera RCEF 2490 TaxID=1081109 RepID=A0A168D408_9HYPO|nr:hypothetical protein AAL_03292 [Moelleriella libera RCEF 2490]